MIKILAILCISILEGIALFLGIDGQLFAVVIAVLAGLAGYEFGTTQTQNKNKP